MLLEFNSTEKSFTRTLTSESEIFTNCDSVHVSRNVCDHEVTNYAHLSAEKHITLKPGTYTFTASQHGCINCCWVCIDQPVTTPDNTVDNTVCEPSISEIFGGTPTLFSPLEFTAIAVHNPSCCAVKVTTSAGMFTVKPNENGVEESFDCVVTLQGIEVSGDNCDPSTVHTILTKRF